MSSRSVALFALLGVTIACAPEGRADEDTGITSLTLGGTDDPTGDSTTDEPTTTGPETGDGDGDATAEETGPELPQCSPPDVLIVLDRTGTMYLDVGGMVPAGVESSRWTIAVEAIEAVVEGLDGEGTPLDQTVRFGLELFPQYHPDCATVAELIGGGASTNPTCQGPELLVPPALDSGAAIVGQIDPSTGELCESTPMRQAIEGAGAWLTPLADEDHEQFVLLVTDGVDAQSFCSGPPIDGYPDSLIAVQNLEAAGIRTFILGVGTGFATTGDVHQTMNDFACAGGTAPNPEINCVAGAMGMVAVAGVDEALYFAAGDTPELISQLIEATEQVCCGCVPVG